MISRTMIVQDAPRLRRALPKAARLRIAGQVLHRILSGEKQKQARSLALPLSDLDYEVLLGLCDVGPICKVVVYHKADRPVATVSGLYGVYSFPADMYDDLHGRGLFDPMGGVTPAGRQAISYKAGL